MHRDVIVDLHGRKDVTADEIEVVSLDEFCGARGIPRIDFLKLDTEGHEFAVLKGVALIPSEGRIRAIQFEFNEMNIVTRVFLKDFYALLEGFAFYRLEQDRLLPLVPTSRGTRSSNSKTSWPYHHRSILYSASIIEETTSIVYFSLN